MVFFSTLAGFAFAKLAFKGRTPLLVFVVATLAIPVVLVVVFARGGYQGNGAIFSLMDVRQKVFSAVNFRFQRVRDGKPVTTLRLGQEVTVRLRVRALEKAAWGPATLIRDVPAEVARLKAQDGVEIQVHGSSNLLQTLLKHGLVNELRVWTFPVLLGGGKRLFEDGVAPGSLKLVGSTVSTTGVIIATYQPDGAIRYGSFALEEPAPEEAECRHPFDG